MVAWWEPSSFPLALATALVSTACWGSWSNSAKAAGESGINFAHFYMDFCIGTVLAALLFWVLPGRQALGESDVDLGNNYFALGAGAVFGVANLLLTTGIARAGLSVAFPLCIGTALVFGTLLTYWVDQRGQLLLLFPGVLTAFLGVIANAQAYGWLQSQREEERLLTSRDDERSSVEEEAAETSASQESAAPGSVGGNIAICLVGGVLMSLWAPLSAKAAENPGGLSPYWSFVLFTAASLVVGVCIVSGQQCGLSLMPRVGAATGVREYAQMKPWLHGWGLLGGSVWALGTAANLVSGDPLGHALSYSLGQTAPVVAVLWGLLWYREFNGAPTASLWCLAAMFACFFVAIVLLCLGAR